MSLESPSPSEPKQPSVTREPPPGRKFPCLKCGARLDFDPRSRALACPYCGFREEIKPGETAAIERDLEEYLSRQTGDTVVAGLKWEVKCSVCAAVVLLADKVAAGNCPYCGTFLENQPESAQAMVAPESLIPFVFDRRKASAAFETWLASRWFAPNALKKLAVAGRFQGIYVPFWTFDSMTISAYQGERGDDYQDTENYTETESYVEDGQTKTREVWKTRTVTKTNWWPVSGEVQHFFDDVLVCASAGLPGPYAADITAKELQDLEAFKPEFLSGFTTERYTLGPREGFATARGIMDREIRGLCTRDIGGDHQRLHAVQTQHVGVTFKHMLLPIWLANYRYHDKTYRVMVNGQTGQVTGDRPYSWAKITGLILLIAGIILALVLMFGGMR